MKTLFTAFSILVIAAACNMKGDSSKTDLQQKQQEVNKDYREDVQDASKERNEDLKDAREDFNEEQKEEAKDYLDESDGARVDETLDRINVDESADQ
ncbi:MAG: hypothetical protein H0V66_10165 [Bdellovibrionales bacterium]|nr:hypothetical protein [Bdellovibrionales bacterium]